MALAPTRTPWLNPVAPPDRKQRTWEPIWMDRNSRQEAQPRIREGGNQQYVCSWEKRSQTLCHTRVLTSAPDDGLQAASPGGAGQFGLFGGASVLASRLVSG